MDKVLKITTFSIIGVLGLATLGEAVDRKAYENILDGYGQSYSTPFNNSAIWEYGQEQNNIGQKILTLAALALVDLNQSKTAFAGGYYELNPILGKHPSVPKMLGFGLAGIGALYISEKLLKNYPRLQQILIDSAITTEAFNVEENMRLVTIGARQYEMIPIIITVRF